MKDLEVVFPETPEQEKAVAVAIAEGAAVSGDVAPEGSKLEDSAQLPRSAQ